MQTNCGNFVRNALVIKTVHFPLDPNLVIVIPIPMYQLQCRLRTVYFYYCSTALVSLLRTRPGTSADELRQKWYTSRPADEKSPTGHISANLVTPELWHSTAQSFIKVTQPQRVRSHPIVRLIIRRGVFNGTKRFQFLCNISRSPISPQPDYILLSAILVPRSWSFNP